MKKNINTYYPAAFLAVIISFLFLACSTGNKWNNIEFYNVEKAEQTTETPVPSDDEEIESLRDTAECSIDVSVDMQFMKSDNEENENVCDLINSHLLEIVLKQSSDLTIEEAVDNYVEERKKELVKEAFGAEMYEHITGHAEYGIENIITYRVETEYFAGGAHPYSLVNILTFDALTGDLIDLDKVFLTSCHKEINEMLTRKLIHDLGKNNLQEIQEEGYLYMNEMFVSTNFALREDSVEFFYNSYDIAPYACGSSAICLSYEELTPYMSSLYVKK